MVKFNVAAPNGKTESYEGDYKITDGGVLSVKPGSGNPVIFSPAGWLALEVTDAPERPGDTRDLLSG
jgi:hypothetical protein